jgi:long-chain acyl-CoA synthetase
MYQERVTDALHYAERFHFDRRAVIGDDGSTITYPQFASRCRRVAGTLSALGVARGDRVATLMLNRSEYLELNFAVPGLGAALVLLNVRHSAAELRSILGDCTPRVLIVDDAHAEVAAQVEDLVPLVVNVDGTDLQSHDPVELGIGFGEDEPAAIYYTGGTTGDPKGVVISHRNLVSSAHRVNTIVGFRADDVVLHATPMFHFSDSAWTIPLTWAGGAHTILPKFEAGSVLEAIERDRVTYQCFMPTMLMMLFDHEDFTRRDTSSLRIIVQGGASEQLLQEAARVWPNCSFRNFYGMTESAAHLTGIVDQQKLIGTPQFSSVGKPVPGIFVDVCRPDGSSCAPGEIGEIVADAANIMIGYWNKPELTAEVLRDGVYRTGDLGKIDDSRNLYLVDRIKDMIKSGGENVYSVEVERALLSHPAVKEAAVFGVADDRLIERVHAAVVVRAGHETTPPELIDHCRRLIAGYKIPRSFEFRDDFPKSPSGKILKRVMRHEHTGA